MVIYLIVAIIAYAIGSVNFSVIVGKKMAGVDVREKGSGNAGTTNVLRNIGKKAAAITLLCDILKGVVAIVLAIVIGKVNSELNPAILVQIAAIFVLVGHVFPIFFGFKGGKGVATSIGILLLINWKIGLICLVFGIILIALTQMVSLGSISSAILFPVLTVFIHECYIIPGNYIIFSVLICVFILYNHRSNIKRLLNGTENRISLKKNKEI